MRCCCSGGISAGEEVTISYGSNKSNLALLSCYGFQIPGNPNDVQLVAPVFKSCLAAAGSGGGGGGGGFDPQVLQEAAAGLLLKQTNNNNNSASQQQQLLLSPELVEARQQSALAALPADQQAEGGPSKQSLQQQRYLAQLMLYQLKLIFKRCGTSIEEDLAELGLLEQQGVAASGGSVCELVEQQAVSARLEHKLLLYECERLLDEVLLLLEGAQTCLTL